MLFIFGGLVALVVVLLVVFMASEETYTKAKLFSNGDRFLTMNSHGNIVLQPVADVDAAIDDAAASIAADRTSILKGYQPKGNYQPAGHYQPAGNYQPKGNYQPAGNYLNLDDAVYIQNKGKGNNWFGSYGDRGGFYGHTQDGGKKARHNKWTFVQ